jgi:RNA polymerase sigma factor (sigma-70 family)
MLKRTFDETKESIIVAKSDKELLEGIQQKDPQAFTALYNKYWRLLYSWSMRRIGDRSIVQDLMQNVWAEIWQNPTCIKVNSEGSAKSILLGFVSYRILDFFKKKELLVFHSEEWGEYEGDEALSYTHVIEDVQVKEIQACINAVLEKLPKLARDIYCMSEVEQLSDEEVAHRLLITTETVRRRKAWTNNFIRKEVGKYSMEGSNLLIVLLYANLFLK